ncbi:MAG TPA: BBP7 family outer membrane beta-barrel protein, partial [Thermoguttaceae bacterium]|nr:BBP7 family outer membrane beta-barrel protein [Thermoguttaceae bacterium]
NFATQTSRMTDNDSTIVLRDFDRHVGELAFIGDLRLGLTYQVTQCMAATLGYQVTWVEGVALAPEQLSYNSTPNSGNRVNTDGSLFFDGGYAGLTIRR